MKKMKVSSDYFYPTRRAQRPRLGGSATFLRWSVNAASACLWFRHSFDRTTAQSLSLK